jgi:uncharacterized protein
VVFGAAGAFLGNRLPVPAGVLVGTLVGVGSGSALSNVLLGLPQPPIPTWVNGLLQISLGMFVGLRMSKDSLRAGGRALVPASLLAVLVISTAVASALIVVPLTHLDVVTVLFAAAPGGMTEMSAVGVSFGADGAAVTTVQLVRVLLAVTVVNVLLGRLAPKGEPASRPQEEKRDGTTERTEHKEDLKKIGLAAPWGILGGFVGTVSSVPAGGIIGALIGSAAFRLLTGREVPVRTFQLGVQALAGGVIGLGVSGEFFGNLLQLAGAGALIISTQMFLWLGTGWLLAKAFRYDLPTSVLASTPGGLSEVVSTSGQTNADVVIVTFIHLVRLSTIIVVVPILVALVFDR